MIDDRWNLMVRTDADELGLVLIDASDFFDDGGDYGGVYAVAVEYGYSRS